MIERSSTCTRPSDEDTWDTEPVYVTERVPASGEHGVSWAEAEREGIPLPAHLRVSPELARGGMGRVHAATDRNLLRHVALKRLDPALAHDQFHRDCFIAEAQITGQLEHPGIVPVHELSFDEAGAPYYTMKLVRGRSFDDWLREPEHAPGTSARLEGGLEILLKVCDAVAYAHHRGVIHRDLKPGNVMVGDYGEVYVMDWGLARVLRAAPGYEAPGARSKGCAGTLGYMSPEQARGDDADERSDVFALGALLYELLTDAPPYGRDRDPLRVLDSARRGAVVPLAVAAPEGSLPEPLCAIVERATHVDPDRRPQSVVDLRDALRGFLRRGLHLPRRDVAAGTLILREGEPGDAAFMITSGRCRVYRGSGAGQQTLATLGPGDVFGEMAPLLDVARVASVEALTPVTLLVLGKAVVAEQLGISDWTGTLVRGLARRLRDLTLQLDTASEDTRSSEPCPESGRVSTCGRPAPSHGSRWTSADALTAR
jgi:eukaryotic-like serine/threonine-protein kinase